ncbi:hypothetical protein OK016_29805 [Vibrio chagasii]|nr:hypothetical protein [Vibrio chagasii]
MVSVPSSHLAKSVDEYTSGVMNNLKALRKGVWAGIVAVLQASSLWH